MKKAMVVALWVAVAGAGFVRAQDDAERSKSDDARQDEIDDAAAEGRDRVVMNLAKERLKSAPGDRKALAALAAAAENVGEYDDADAAAEALLKSDPEDAS